MMRNVLLSALVLGGVACVVHADDVCDYDEHYVCYLEYTPFYGYSRVCEWQADPVSCIEYDDGDGRYRRRPTSENTSGVSSGEGSDAGSGAPAAGEPAAEEPASDSEPSAELSCSRHSQCGTGLCVEGQCFYGCETAADCGTGDGCLDFTGTLVCREPETPELECTRSAECASGQVCLNAVCHDGCETTADCSNQLDRCEGSICVPDRSVVSECLLDRECPSGQACIDAACQPR